MTLMMLMATGITTVPECRKGPDFATSIIMSNVCLVFDQEEDRNEVNVWFMFCVNDG